jgi:hypothetical protein
MTRRPIVLDHQGDYIKHEPVAAFGAISDEVYSIFHDATGGHDKKGERPRDHLITRLMYMAETTSTALRLNVSWALSIPGMSLARDRYEQVVRFSWLARQPDNVELVKFINTHYAKADKVMRSIDERIAPHMDVLYPNWRKEPLPKKEREKLSEWENLDLLSMATKRDKLMPAKPSQIDEERLADLYAPVYQQFSSVSHCDMYGVNMLGLHEAPSGQLVLAPSPWWPAMLCGFNSLFDLIQCHAAISFMGKDSTIFDEVHSRWQKLNRKMVG